MGLTPDLTSMNVNDVSNGQQTDGILQRLGRPSIQFGGRDGLPFPYEVNVDTAIAEKCLNIEVTTADDVSEVL
jgi:diadenosine tetraphosphatase ApaH/serine/threonine PP2A family protein phosphatase